MARPPQPLDVERETRLLRSAASSFTKSGYELASLNQIIANARWAKSSFYHYFPDKRSLHDHVVLTLRSRGASQLALPVIDELTPATFWTDMSALGASLALASSQNSEFRLLTGMFVHESAARSPDGQLTRLRTDVANWFGHAAHHGRQIGEIRRDLPETLITNMAQNLVKAICQWAQEEPTQAALEPSLGIRVLREVLGDQSSTKTSLEPLESGSNTTTS